MKIENLVLFRWKDKGKRNSRKIFYLNIFWKFKLIEEFNSLGILWIILPVTDKEIAPKKEEEKIFQKIFFFNYHKKDFTPVFLMPMRVEKNT